MYSPNVSKTVTYCIILSEEEYNQIKNLAALGFDVTKISRVLEKDLRLFKRDWKTKGTPIYEAYHTGCLEAQAEIDGEIQKSAAKGTIPAIQLYKKLQEDQMLENMKEEIFNTE
jgi:hypothetical protein